MLPLSFQSLLPKMLPLQRVKRACVGLSLCICGWTTGSVAQEISTSDCIVSDVHVRIEKGAFEKLDGKKIRKITYKQLNVFDENDPKENNGLYRFLNALHFTTRESVIESQLLFQVGDSINHQSLDESARILRTRSYLSDAYIMPEAVCGDQVDVLVVTKDSWALEPRVSYSRESNDNKTGFGINDGNIFGTGNSLTIGYTENQQRNAINYDFSNPHIFNKPVAVRLSFADTSDGKNTIVDVSHPFYALDTPWSAGGRLADLSQIDIIRSRGVAVNEFRHRAVENVAYFGLATDINSNFTQRWLVGATHEEDSFFESEETQSGIPARDKAVYPWIEYQYIENKFGVLKNVNQIQRLEDIAVGQKVTVRLGVAGKTFGNPDDVVRYKIDYENFVEASEKHLFEFAAKLDGRQHLGISGLDPNILTSSVVYHYLQDDKNRWYARAEFGIGENLPQYKEFTVGDITGLRGYPTDYLRGNKRYAFTLERRYFSDIYLFNLIRMGSVVFVDSGKAWGLPNEPYSPLLTNVGVGLRFSSTKVRVGNVARIDIAMPTAAKSGLSKTQVTIGAYQKF